MLSWKLLDKMIEWIDEKDGIKEYKFVKNFNPQNNILKTIVIVFNSKI